MQDHFRIFEYVFVLKSKNSDSEISQEQPPIIIALGGVFVEVTRSVKLDRKLLGGTIKVENVTIETVLSAELSSLELRAFQHRPKACLGRC
jgi:hypothetical protein